MLNNLPLVFTCASWNKLAKVYSETSVAMVLARPEYVAHRVELTDPMSEELPSTTALSNFIKHASVVVLFIQCFLFVCQPDGRPVISRTYNVYLEKWNLLASQRCFLSLLQSNAKVPREFGNCEMLNKWKINLTMEILCFVYYYEDNL